jgi:RNA polymerase subunit RPABC4/transcription elongation factor Spt4
MNVKKKPVRGSEKFLVCPNCKVYLDVKTSKCSNCGYSS